MTSSTPPPNRAARRGLRHAGPRDLRTAPKDLLTTDEACACLRVSKPTLREYISLGLIHPIRLGPKLLRFDPADLDALLS